jgi:hypothetical protein
LPGDRLENERKSGGGANGQGNVPLVENHQVSAAQVKELLPADVLFDELAHPFPAYQAVSQSWIKEGENLAPVDGPSQGFDLIRVHPKSVKAADQVADGSAGHHRYRDFLLLQNFQQADVRQSLRAPRSEGQ